MNEEQRLTGDLQGKKQVRSLGSQPDRIKMLGY